MRSVANEFERQIFAQPAGSAVDKTLEISTSKRFQKRSEVATGAASVAKNGHGGRVNPTRTTLLPRSAN